MKNSDPYALLGVAKDATTKQIRKAYTDLAKKLHPDINPNNPAAEARFKEVSAAHALLADPEMRAKFDRGEIDAEGHEKAAERPYYRDFADQPAGGKYAEQEGFANEEDLQAFMADLFARRSGGHNIKAKGGDLNYRLDVTFLEAAKGDKKTVTMPDGRTLKINIPAGLRHQQSLRLRGQGLAGYNGGPPGDAYVEVHVKADPVFSRKDDDIHVEVPISLNEAILGGKIDVPTIDGPVTMTIPKYANSGTRLRLRDKGLPAAKGKQRGHQFVTLKVVLPSESDGELATFIEDWAKSHPYNPRKATKSGAKA
ncbi:MAG: J domain-containing protein [Rhodospirillales bacterium]|nr:J domain-containing protein [Rhodospirillales bacterium]